VSVKEAMRLAPAEEKEMAFDTHAQAIASLREFATYLRAAHKIVKFWSTTHGRYRYCRVLMSK
jgi:hypothetical protein